MRYYFPRCTTVLDVLLTGVLMFHPRVYRRLACGPWWQLFCLLIPWCPPSCATSTTHPPVSSCRVQASPGAFQREAEPSERRRHLRAGVFLVLLRRVRQISPGMRQGSSRVVRRSSRGRGQRMEEPSDRDSTFRLNASPYSSCFFLSFFLARHRRRFEPRTRYMLPYVIVFLYV